MIRRPIIIRALAWHEAIAFLIFVVGFGLAVWLVERMGVGS